MLPSALMLLRVFLAFLSCCVGCCAVMLQVMPRLAFAAWMLLVAGGACKEVNPDTFQVWHAQGRYSNLEAYNEVKPDSIAGVAPRMSMYACWRW